MRYLSSLAAVSGVMAFALLVPAQANPAAAQPGSVEIAGEPTDDAAARQLLTDAAAAIVKMGPVSFRARAAMKGGPITMNGDAEVVFIRNNGVPTDSLFFAKGRMEMPALPNPNFFLSRYADAVKGRRLAWQDDAAKIVYDRPDGPGPDGGELEGARQAGVVLRSVLMPLLINATPLSDELKVSRAGTDEIKFACVFLPDEKVGDELCKVIKVYMKKGSTERTVWVSPTDKLPRKYEQMRSGMARHWELLDLKPASSEDVKLKTPDGYKFDSSDESGIIKPAAVQPVQPAAVTLGGPQIGQIAPDFDLKTTEGSSVSLASLKGQTVVLCFGGSRFPGSWSGLALSARAAEGKAAKVVAMACREADNAKAAEAFSAAGGTGQLLLNADATAALYQVRGYPSTCVVGPDGKVLAFFEGEVTAEQLAAALAGK